MSTNETTQEILELIEANRDDAPSPEQQARLRELLTQSAEARRLFVQEQMLDAAFYLAPAPSHAGAVAAAINRPAEARKKPAHSSWLWAAAAAVLFALGLGAGGWLKEPASPTLARTLEPVDNSIALVTQSVDAVWAGKRKPRPGTALSAGRLHLESGLTQIEFYSGARLILDGPVELELVSANEAVCHAGRLRALVPPQARGFSVTSPQFKLVDLGTEFSMEVAKSGSAKVQVFDGEVELHASNQVHRITCGAGVEWASSGEKADIPADPGSFPSFDDLRDRTRQQSLQRYAAWREWNQALADDPRVAVRYDFEADSNALQDSGSTRSHGLIIGCEHTNGRWAEKGALEFKRPSDRVRVNIPGSYDALTFTAWIRVDAQPERHMALLLTDGFEVARPHWQLTPPGDLRLGLRIPSEGSKRETTNYTAPNVITPGRIGVWSLVATVYDRQDGRVKHYLNGRQVSSEVIRFDQPLTIGSAEIGNWGVTLGKGTFPVRNFVGRMDEFTLWKVALSSAELAEMHRRYQP